MRTSESRPGRSWNMSWRRFYLCALPAVALLLLGCRSKPQGEHTTITPPLLEPVVPAGYKKIAPASLDDSGQMLGQTAAIFRGSLKSVQFTYEGCAGPRTNYVFSDSSSLVGERVQSTVTVRVLGGPTPGGKWVGVSELPKLALDSQYVVFLRNTDWTFSPIVGNLVFRVEKIAGKEVLVHPSGRAVTGWGEDGPVLSVGSVSEVVGSKLHGYRTSDAPAAGDRPTSAVPDAKGELRSSDHAEPAPARTQDSVLASAPSLAETRKAGLFARPALSPSAIANEPTVSIDSFVAATRAAAEQAQVNIGGRLTLDPNWKCWSFTPTARAAR
jgi:hypothetical protein